MADDEAFEDLYNRWKAARFPDLGKEVGDFMMVMDVVDGLASRFVAGNKIDPRAVDLTPDEETLEFVAALRRKEPLNWDERVFLEYYERMDAVRKALEAAARRQEGQEGHSEDR